MDYDQDGDGAGSEVHGFDDCDDNNAGVYPGATEVPYDGLDQDCEGGDLTDVDGDGYDASEVGGLDCDDTDPSINPNPEPDPVAEVDPWYDGVDQNCDGLSDYDKDRDGHDSSSRRG